MQVNHIPRVMKHALQCPELEDDYQECWAGLKSHFKEVNGSMAHPLPYAPVSNHTGPMSQINRQLQS